MARFRRGAFPGGNPWQFFRSMHPESGLGRENRQFVARFARHASEMSWLWQDMRAMHPKSPANRRWRIHRAKILPGRGTFRCTGPSNHARRADLAIRRRTARAIAATAPPLWAAERGAGGFLSGGVTLLKECVVLWGVERWRQSWHQQSFTCESLTPIISPNLESQHSRGGFRAGRRQGGAGQAAPPSEARVLATSSSAFKEKVNQLILFLLTIPPWGI